MEVKQKIEKSKVYQGGKRGVQKLVFGRTALILLLLVLNFTLMFTAMLYLADRIALVFGGVTVFTAVMLIYVLNSRENPSIKLSWCVLIAVFPLFGAMLYFFVRLNMGHRLSRKIQKQTTEESCAYIADQSELLEQIRDADRDLYNFAHYMLHSGSSPIYGNTEVTYFPLGEDKFAEMLVQLEKAEKFIFLEYFFIGESYMWDAILKVLKRKAEDGVEVRVMYDGSSGLTYLPHDYPEKLKALGIQCKVFSPFQPFVSTHYNNRDHRKILVIDGHTAFTGGVNLQDRYINRKKVYGHWKDTAVMVRGDAARSFTLMFLQMWNAMEKERVYAPYLTAPQAGNQSRGYVIPYGDSPLDDERVGETVYLNMLNQAKDYVYIMTPYLILDNEMLTAMQFAAKRGVDVRIVLPHIPDKKTAFALAKSHYRELVEAGVRIYEYTPGFMHAKVFLSDDKHGVVGTINLDYRSLYLHYECAAYLYDVPALQDIHTDFVKTMEVSREITMDEIRGRGFFGKMVSALLKVVAPLM